MLANEEAWSDVTVVALANQEAPVTSPRGWKQVDPNQGRGFSLSGGCSEKGRSAGNHENPEEERGNEEGDSVGRGPGVLGAGCGLKAGVGGTLEVRGFGVHAGESLVAVQATPNMGLLIPRNNGNCPMQNGDR